jgi:transposase
MRKLAPSGAHWLRELIHAAVKGSDEQRYLHRLHCVLLVAEGRSCYEVARWFGESPRTIERWVHALDDRGMEGLREHHGGGRPARLTAAQAQRLATELQRVPDAQEYPKRAWSGRLLTKHLQGTYGIKLSARQCQRLLRRLASGEPRKRG